ncbi:hypothetical protein CY34DRAFT_203385 [Suillus luteus UH-Slu-Lm8-n1]|uniref:Uncharacterized protein n=1 Tax=Suillus luteus UH-Slu-Lm8-n1 TaxID=930992 RepID=A0A0D0AU15_9AGAM|nr:hypothetical protein CY34DRAFT_203385 [Suillus luteus UH-Slu-Lm8-n1]
MTLSFSTSFSTSKRHSKQMPATQTKLNALAGLRAEHVEYEKALDDVRAEQARARTAVVREETKVKKAEKALEAKEPELVEVDAQIKHSSRKLQNSQKIQEQVGNNAGRQQAKLHSLRRDISNARQAADEAAEAYRRPSQHNTSLSENSLAEYRSL